MLSAVFSGQENHSAKQLSQWKTPFMQFILLFLFAILLPLNAVDSISPVAAAPQSEDSAVVTHEPAIEVKTPEVVKSEPKAPVSVSESPSVVLKAEAAPRTPKVGLESVAIPEGTSYFVGSRYYEKKAGGWGWIKKPEENWKQAKWVAIQETPKKYFVPHRGLKSSDADHEFQYKLLGSFADYQIYDPVRDELLDVFIIQGYESLGLQKSIERKPGPPSRFSSKKSGAYTRRNSVQFDEDGF